MTEAEVLEIDRRDISKGIEEARKAGVVAGSIARLSVSTASFLRKGDEGEASKDC